MQITRSKSRFPRALSCLFIENCEQRSLMSTYTVNTSSDAIKLGAGSLTLRQAVAEANAHAGADTIVFAPKVFTPASLHTITLTQGEIVLADNTTINGPGSAVLAISGGGDSRQFAIAAGVSVQISNLQLTGGNQKVADGSGNTHGGAIYNAGNLKISNCVITKNSVVGMGETPYDAMTELVYAGIASGGAIYSTGSLAITNSTLSDNSVTNISTNDSDAFPPLARASFGGAIYCTGAITLNGDIITDNTVSGNNSSQTSRPVAGGGVYTGGFLTISSSTIIGNQITAPATGENGYGGSANGGGVYAGGTLFITDSAVDSNKALAGDSGYSEDNSGVGRGGGIYAAGGVTITNSVIHQNLAQSGLSDTADDYFGNEIPAAGGGLFATLSATLSSDSIDSNTVIGGAGDPSATQVPTAAGGGIYAGSLLLRESSVADNTVLSEFEYGVSEYRSGGLAIGGGVITTGISSISASTIAGNSVTGGDGYDSFIDLEDGMGTAAGDGLGGGIYTSAAMTVTSSTIANNAATGGVGGSVEDSNEPGFDGGVAAGGGIYSSAALTLYDSTITFNSTTGGAGGIAGFGFPSGKQGIATAGGIDITAGVLTLFNSIISANLAAKSFADIQGTAASQSGGNLIGVGGGLTNNVNGNKLGITNPKLSPLEYYGGPTQTLLPLPDSPVIDAGSNSLIPTGLTTDQRGDPRISEKAVDIGSVEFGDVTITGTVFNDQYASGQLQKGDTGVAGFTVYLDLNHDGTLDAGDMSTVTNSAGQYTFNGLFAGNYAVCIQPQKAYRPTTATLANITAKADSTTTVSPFGQTQDALISGTVLKGQTPLANVRVYIDLTGSGTFRPGDPSTLTNSSGLFSLNISAMGIYKLRIIPLPGHKLSNPGSGFYTVTVGKASIRGGFTFNET